jgi:Tfp pilus assembly protein PilN
MIIRNNLSSNPIKNYSVYLIGCIVLAITAALFTVYNMVSLSSWFAQSRTVGRLISEQQKQLVELKHDEQKLRSQIVAVKTPDFVRKADFINNAIKRRVFSWTKLFDQFERAFPDNVKMVSVSPAIDQNTIRISMQVAGRNLDDIVKLITVLENSPAFRDVTFRSEQSDPDGLLHATISLQYLPENAPDVITPVTQPNGTSVVEPNNANPSVQQNNAPQSEDQTSDDDDSDDDDEDSQ